MSEPDNAMRADWAEAAVNVFSETTYCGRQFTDTVVEQPGKDGDAYTMIMDLIANCMHLAARHGWDAKEMVDSALRTFDDEVMEESET